MLKTYLYVPDHLDEQIVHTAKAQKRSKADVIRQALEEGLALVQQKGTASAQALLRLARLGEKYNPKGPSDLSQNLDKYLWGMENG